MNILIVEDSKAMRMIIARALQQAGLGGAVLAEAATGREALETIRESRPDLVLCDWDLPEMNGIELLRALRAEGCDVTFGFVTAGGTPDMRRQASESGAALFVTKPFTAETFRDALAPIVGSVAGSTDGRSGAGPW